MNPSLQLKIHQVSNCVFDFLSPFLLTALSPQDVSKIIEKLSPNSNKWEEIGERIGFSSLRLQNIRDMPSLFNSAPSSYLRQMLCEWQQWAPGDARGSSSYATLEALVSAVDRAGLGRAAQELASMAFTLSSSHTP